MKTIFLFLVIFSLLIFYLGIRDFRKIIFFICWGLIVSIISFYEVFIHLPFLFVFVLIGSFVVCSFIYRSSTKRNMRILPLILIHLIRIPVEFVLFQLYKKHLVPIEMTFLGLNFDLFFGISTIFILLLNYYFKNFKESNWFKTWNIIGIIFLLNVLFIGIFSSPLPIQFIAYDNPNIAVLAFPFSLLPAIVVPVMLLSHIFLIKHMDTE